VITANGGVKIYGLDNADTMGERIGRIRRIETDFFVFFCLEPVHLNPKKSVRIRPIRPIRSPIVSQNPPIKKELRTALSLIPFFSCLPNSNK
jgi:hypothetical protein